MENIQGFHVVFFLWIIYNRVLVTDAVFLFPESISCNSSSLVQIDSIYIYDKCTQCPTDLCVLNQDDTNEIEGNCNNKTECQLPSNFTTTCLEEYGSYDISYDCKVLCTFENDDCGFTNVPGFDTKWFRSNGADQSHPKKDHTINSKNGYFMKINASTPGSGRLKTEELYNPGEICFTFYYQVFGPDFITFYIFVKMNNETNMFRFVDLSTNKQDEWQKWGPHQITGRGFFAIIFEGSFRGAGSIAVDDILFFSGNCREMSNFSESGVKINTPFTLQGCPSLLLNYRSIRIEIHENLEDVSDNSCSLNYADILEDISVYCNERPEIFCTFNLLELIGNRKNCFSLRKELIINYSCKVNVTSVSSLTTSDAEAGNQLVYILLSLAVFIVIVISVLLYALWKKRQKPMGQVSINSAEVARTIPGHAEVNFSQIELVDKTPGTSQLSAIDMYPQRSIHQEPTPHQYETVTSYEELNVNRESIAHTYEVTNQYEQLDKRRNSAEHTYETTIN